jgi:hypothetical protein
MREVSGSNEATVGLFHAVQLISAIGLRTQS